MSIDSLTDSFSSNDSTALRHQLSLPVADVNVHGVDCCNFKVLHREEFSSSSSSFADLYGTIAFTACLDRLSNKAIHFSWTAI